jgi:hypothetical protein
MSLTIQEFQSAFFPIENRWKKAHNGDQVALIKEVADRYTFEQFKSVCKYILGSTTRAPMVPDFEKAFIHMRFVPKSSQSYSQTASVVRSEEDFFYHLRDNIWASNEYIHIRNEEPSKCSFILKKDNPNHELVQLDRELCGQRIAEIKAEQEKILKKLVGAVGIPMIGRAANA